MEHWTEDECEIAALVWAATERSKNKSAQQLAVARAIGRTAKAVRSRYEAVGPLFVRGTDRVAHNRKTGRHDPVTADEARAMAAAWREGKTYSEIAIKFRRGRTAVQNAVQSVVPAAERHALHGKMTIIGQAASAAGRAEALLRRDAARQSAPRSLTAMVFGDPPPGRSALDLRAAR